MYPDAMARQAGLNRWLVTLAAAVIALVLAAAIVWRDDILEAWLDPKVPFTVYTPPPAPDFDRQNAWAILPRSWSGDSVAVFFIHPTTFDGGRNWNGPIDDARSDAIFSTVFAPNYAAPFAEVGDVFAPRYRQASLYTSLSLFDDALEAREFAYRDVKDSFEYFLQHIGGNRPFVLVGVEQGGVLGSRLLTELIGPNKNIRKRMVAAYLQETVAPADEFGPEDSIPACRMVNQSGCVLAWISIREGDIARALRIRHRSVVWDANGRLVALGDRLPLCVNPLLGRLGNDVAPARLNLGAANASGLEWGTRPGFLTRQVGAVCYKGILSVTRPRSASLQPPAAWPERLRAPPYNLFYANIIADLRERILVWKGLSQLHSAKIESASQTFPAKS